MESGCDSLEWLKNVFRRHARFERKVLGSIACNSKGLLSQERWLSAYLLHVESIIEKLASESQYDCNKSTASLHESIIAIFKIKIVFNYIYPLHPTEIDVILSKKEKESTQTKKLYIELIALVSKLNNKEEPYPSVANYLAKYVKPRQPVPRNG